MPVDFSAERWSELRETYASWWAGTLERPIVPVVLWGKAPERPMPAAPFLSQEICADLSIAPEALVDRLDYELSTRVYLGDSFPFIGLDAFGPGVAAAFLGADLDTSTGRVWFHAKEQLPIEEIHFTYDADNAWLKRVKAICAAARDRWEGRVLVGMTDLGGTLDVLSTFRPSALLPMDLYDSPDEVKRLTQEIHELWFRFYDEINEILQPVSPGFSDWGGIYSSSTSYMLQCDFAYMIGPEAFREFVLPELTASCQRLSHSFYHLDGPGQLPHLDALLATEALDGVQWIPGDGNGLHWPEVYRKIHASGKRMQVLGGLGNLKDVIGQVGSGKGMCSMAAYAHVSEEQEIRAALKDLGA